MTSFAEGRRSTLTAAAVFGLLLAALPSAARADDFDLCNQAGTNPDAGIPACTRLLARKDVKEGIDAVHFNRARGHAKNGALDSAIDDYNSAINLNPKNINALRNRGNIWYQKSDFDRALADFSKIIAIDPKNPVGFSSRGVALTQKGEYDRAITDFNKALALDGKNVLTLKNRAHAFLQRRDLNRAIADYDLAIKLSPTDSTLFNDRGEVWLAKGDYDRAITDFSETIRLKPDNWRGYSSRGEAKRAKGDLNGAIADHDEAINRDAKAYEAYGNRALVWKDKGDLDRALEDLNEALLWNSSSGQALALRGEIFRLKGDLGKSKADLEILVKLFPNFALPHCRLGDTLRDIGMLDQALKEFDLARAAQPKALCSYVGRGSILEKNGAFEAAKAEFEKATTMSVEGDNDPVIAREAQAAAKLRFAAVEKTIAERKANARPASDPESEARLAALQEQARQREEQARLAKEREDRAQQQVAALQEQLRQRLEAEQKSRQEDPSKAARPIDQGVRVALVIGNSKYENVSALANPPGDANAVAAAFQKIGFQKVIVKHDLTRQTLLAALREFEEVADKADWAVIYYAGHGMELGGVNYVIPVDARLRADRDVSDEAVPLERVMTTVQRTRKLRLIILDACRDNPFLTRMQRVLASRSVGRGLADVEPEGGILVAFAARGGQFAYDGEAGQRSPFVKAFLQHIQTPQLEIGILFRRVRDDVMKTTERKQEPFVYGSLPGDNFYFVAK
jgi:tetratricopeptide (TPR) repeat protein